MPPGCLGSSTTRVGLPRGAMLASAFCGAVRRVETDGGVLYVPEDEPAPRIGAELLWTPQLVGVVLIMRWPRAARNRQTGGSNRHPAAIDIVAGA